MPAVAFVAPPMKLPQSSPSSLLLWSTRWRSLRPSHHIARMQWGCLPPSASACVFQRDVVHTGRRRHSWHYFALPAHQL